MMELEGIVMEESVGGQASSASAADLHRQIDEMLAEIDALHRKMQADQAEIEQASARTQTKLEELRAYIGAA